MKSRLAGIRFWQSWRMNLPEGKKQICFLPSGEKLQCTGEQWTGCMFCPVGCHLTDFGKFKRLKKFNPRLYDYCMEELGEKKLLDWVEKNYARGSHIAA